MNSIMNNVFMTLESTGEWDNVSGNRSRAFTASHKTVSKLKEKVAGIEQFDQQPIKVFTKEAGWLRKEPEFQT